MLENPSPRPRAHVLRRRPVLIAAAAVAACVIPVAAAAPSSGAVRTGNSLTGPVTTVAPAYTRTSADSRMAAMLSRRATVSAIGRYFSGAVVDVDSNAVVWSLNGTTGRMPASTAKLVTATDALTVYGPAHRFTTTVRSSDPHLVTLVGAGDPSLSGANLTTLAQGTASQVRAHGVTSVVLRVDDYLFPAPTLAYGWRPGYVPGDVSWVRALVVDGHHATDTSMDAASVFAAKLRAAGVAVSSVARGHAGTAPVIASVQGARLDAIVRQMLLVSDNDHAEALNRLVAVKLGKPATWAAASAVQQTVLAGEGVSIPLATLKDGSGLSRADRLSALQLARVVDNFLEPGQSDLAILSSGALPLAGRTGTLQRRFTTWPSSCAAGRVSAKTGTLSDAAALAGYTRGTDGRLKAFAFVVNYDTDLTTARRALDNLAATVNGCY